MGFGSQIGRHSVAIISLVVAIIESLD